MSGNRMEWTEARLNVLRGYVAHGLSDNDIAKLFGVVKGSITGARTRNLIAPSRPATTPNRPIPEDFATVAPTITIVDATLRYRASRATIRKWHNISKTNPIPRCGRPRKPKVARVYNPQLKQPPIPAREGTQAGMAQAHLQRFFPVFRAKIVDPSASNDTWMVAGRRLPEQDMIELARRKGFEVAA